MNLIFEKFKKIMILDKHMKRALLGLKFKIKQNKILKNSEKNILKKEKKKLKKSEIIKSCRRIFPI